MGFWGVVAIPPPPKCHTVAFLQHPPCDILTTVAEKTQCDIATTLCFYLGILRKFALSNHTCVNLLEHFQIPCTDTGNLLWSFYYRLILSINYRDDFLRIHTKSLLEPAKHMHLRFDSHNLAADANNCKNKKHLRNHTVLTVTPLWGSINVICLVADLPQFGIYHMPSCIYIIAYTDI